MVDKTARKKHHIEMESSSNERNGMEHQILAEITHSMPSMNGVSDQSFSGKRCKIFPVRLPLPERKKKLK